MRRSVRGVVVDFAELSDPGRDPAKQVNEDASSYAETAHGHLAVVCDGMGGHAGGRQASTAAIQTILDRVQNADAALPPPRVLATAIEAAGRAVHAVGGSAPQELRPGSTAVALLVHDGGAEVAHVGDSRAYLIRSGAIQRLTRDHSMVQQMVDAGVISAEEAPHHPEANKITRALGMAPEVDVEIAREPVPLAAGDALLLCTDGLTDLVDDAEILGVVGRRLASGPAVVCQDLVALANDRGGHDNITVQLLHVVEAPPMRPRVPDPTYVDVGAERPSGTLPGETLIDQRGPAKTLPGHERAPPSPTLLDEPQYPERTTQPGGVPPARPAFEAEPAPAPMRTRHARALVMLAGAASAVIVVGVAAWWIVGVVRRPQDDTPPPEPTGAPIVPIAPATSIAPEPEVVPTAPPTTTLAPAPDASPPGDAGVRDAAPRPDAR